VVGRDDKMADPMVARETIWAALCTCRRRRSLAALAAITVLRSERYCPLVNIPRNQPGYREHRHHPRGPPGMPMADRPCTLGSPLWD
jgi:hypothetical protein